VRDLVGNRMARRTPVHIESVRKYQPVLSHESSLSG
jgi:hypothetical protein